MCREVNEGFLSSKAEDEILFLHASVHKAGARRCWLISKGLDLHVGVLAYADGTQKYTLCFWVQETSWTQG